MTNEEFKKEIYLKAKQLLDEHTKIDNIHDLEKTGIFYLNPIIAWHITRQRGITDDIQFFWANPIIPDPFVSGPDCSYDESDKRNTITEAMIPAKNSFLIKQCDSTDFEAYYIDGCIANFSQGYDGLQDFFNRKLKEIIKEYEEKHKDATVPTS